MRKNPKVSVVVPVYNREKELKYTIDSVIQQSYEDWELVIIDNCSTDDTVKIAKSYKDSRIRVIVNDSNIGLYPNWNAGYKHIRGEFYKHLSSDNLISADFIELCMKRFSDEPELDIVATSMGNIDENGNKVSVSRRFSDSTYSAYEVIEKIRSYGDYWLGSPDNQLIRVSFLRAVFGDKDLYNQELRFSADFNFTLDCLLKSSARVGLISRELAFLRRHEGSLTSSEGSGAQRFSEYRYYRDKLDMTRIAYQKPTMLTLLSLIIVDRSKAYDYFKTRRKELNPLWFLDIIIFFRFTYEYLRRIALGDKYVYFR